MQKEFIGQAILIIIIAVIIVISIVIFIMASTNKTKDDNKTINNYELEIHKANIENQKRQQEYFNNIQKKQEKYYYNNILTKPISNNNISNNGTINNKPIEQYPYHKKYLLTKNEYYFYQRLVNVTDPLRLSILAKIRLADLIETNNNLSASEKATYFNKIKSKHIDFAITNQMRIIMIIELDDSSHSNTIERDSFVNNALIKAGYTVVRTNGDMNVITKALIDKGYNTNLYTNTNYYR